MVESRQPELLAIIAVSTVLALLFVASRLYSRYLGHNFSWDDYLIVLSTVLLVAIVGVTWKWILLSGTGYHMRDVPKTSIHDQIITMKWNVAIQTLYHPLMCSIRASIIVFLFRMKDNRRRIRYSLHVVFWINLLYSVAELLVNMFQCRPMRYTWAKPAMDHTDASGKVVLGGTCINSRTFILASCALSIFMDLIIIPIPSIMVWNLQMNIRTKVLVVIVMSLGWIATGVSVGRFVVYYYRFAPSNTDRTWDIGIAISMAEPSIHIMTACAPATKCLFKHAFPSFAAYRMPAISDERSSARTMKPVIPGGPRSPRGGTTLAPEYPHNDSLDAIMGESGDGGEDKSKQAEADVDLQPLASRSSRSYIGGHTGAPKKKKKRPELGGAVVHPSPRTSCTKTGCTDVSEAEEAEPQYCIGEAA